MEEEYIEKIEKTILKCNECKLKECIGCEYTFNELQPLRYLLKRYKELEEENAMLKKAHNISEKVTVEDITQVMNKSLEDFKKEFIPTSVIQKKTKFILDLLRKHKPDLDYEAWSEYKISGSILFDIVYFLEDLAKLKE